MAASFTTGITRALGRNDVWAMMGDTEIIIREHKERRKLYLRDIFVDIVN